MEANILLVLVCAVLLLAIGTLRLLLSLMKSLNTLADSMIEYERLTDDDDDLPTADDVRGILKPSAE